MAVQKQDDQYEHTFSNYVRIRDVVQKTCLRRWTIGKSGERGSGISVLLARHHDDDDDDMYKIVLALNNLQWLICHKTKPNQTETYVCLIWEQEAKVILVQQSIGVFVCLFVCFCWGFFWRVFVFTWIAFYFMNSIDYYSTFFVRNDLLKRNYVLI